MSATVAERVAKGAALLDLREPGWWERIDLDTLDLNSACRCILGQLATDLKGSGWGQVVYRFGLRRTWDSGPRRTDVACGFNVGHPQSLKRFENLTAEWKRVITERRAAA